MNLNRSYKIVFAALFAAQNLWAAAPASNAAVPPDYSTLATNIARGNIFDPNRLPNVPCVPRQRGTFTPAQAGLVNSFSLVGVIGYSEGSMAGTYAFFDGSGQQYRKTVQLNGSIATFKVTEITADSVTLVSDTNKMVLGIGEQLRDGGGGRWLSVNGPSARYSSYNGRNSGRTLFGSGNGNGNGGRRNNNFGN